MYWLQVGFKGLLKTNKPESKTIIADSKLNFYSKLDIFSRNQKKDKPKKAQEGK